MASNTYVHDTVTVNNPINITISDNICSINNDLGVAEK